MYEQYWELDRVPFANHSDPEFYFPSQTHQSALLKLQYVIENRHGAGVLAGGIGSGKTFLVNQLAHVLPEHLGPFVHVIYPRMSPPELLAYIASELGVSPEEIGSDRISLDRILHGLQGRFRDLHRQGRHPVLVIDDCQFIDDAGVFQALQLLLNFRDQNEIDFTLILVGEQSLLPKLRRNAALNDRIGVTGLLQPFTPEETGHYVQHRLRIAGRESGPFSEGALQAIHEFSGGIARRINRLADLALLVGFADQLSQVTANQIEAVAEEIHSIIPD